MMQFGTRAALVGVVLLLWLTLPVSAAILEMTCKDQVTTANTIKNTITVKNPEQYGCEYTASGGTGCSWKPMDTSALTGALPDAAAFSVFKSGEIAVATSQGGPGEQWITLAKVYGQTDTEQLVTDIVGDPRTVPLPLIGDYSVEIETVPDCSNCTGTIGVTHRAKVTIKSGGTAVATTILSAAESFTFNGRNDGSSVMVKFVSGQAASRSCPGRTGMTGPQATSLFVIKVIPSAGYRQVDIRTATTTRPDEALTTFPPTPVATETTPTKSGSLLPLAALTGLSTALLLFPKR